MNKNEIALLVEKHIITKEKSKEIEEFLGGVQEKRRSSLFTMILATLGSLALGVGFLLLVALNWTEIPDPLKLGGGLALITASLLIGYHLAQGPHPHVGKSLLFLGSLLVGAEMALVVQIYHLDVDNLGIFFLVWLALIAPLVYVTQYVSQTIILATLYSLSLGFFITESSFVNSSNAAAYPIVLTLVAALFLFVVGSMHGLFQKLKGMVLTMRRTALLFGLIPLFLLTCEWVYPRDISYFGGWFGQERFDPLSAGIPVAVGFLVVLALAAIGYVKRVLTREEVSFIGLMSLGSLSTVFTLNAAYATYYLVFFNVLFIGLLVYLIYYASMRGDGFLLSAALQASGLYMLIKYFQWLWDAMNAWLLFIVGGLLLTLGAFYFERAKTSIALFFERKKNHTFQA